MKRKKISYKLINPKIKNIICEISPTYKGNRRLLLLEVNKRCKDLGIDTINETQLNNILSRIKEGGISHKKIRILEPSGQMRKNSIFAKRMQRITGEWNNPSPEINCYESEEVKEKNDDVEKRASCDKIISLDSYSEYVDQNSNIFPQIPREANRIKQMLVFGKRSPELVRKSSSEDSEEKYYFNMVKFEAENQDNEHCGMFKIYKNEGLES
ncbi:unnamed protein product [Moneuplotes crassus]|uniref:Uncharacterized protein n=1 Tax=Euplotes crassus TaxID=5936 RepID=A0AAD2D184_EUPCR|nr:unnamed protein product [Moneuplotes crassus]